MHKFYNILVSEVVVAVVMIWGVIGQLFDSLAYILVYIYKKTFF